MAATTSSTTTTNAQSVHPRYATEKIVFLIDVDEEMSNNEFLKKNSSALARLTEPKKSRFDYLKEALKCFVMAKKAINVNHEFAIVLLTTEAIWFQDFTLQTNDFLQKLANLETQGKFKSLDLTAVFAAMPQHLPKVLSTEQDLGFLYRCILIYGRSNVSPEFTGDREMYQKLIESPHFYLDCMYLHEKPGPESKPQDIYDKLTDLETDDASRTAYFLECSTNIKRLWRGFAQLLSHPLQRPEQDHLKFVQWTNS